MDDHSQLTQDIMFESVLKVCRISYLKKANSDQLHFQRVSAINEVNLFLADLKFSGTKCFGWIGCYIGHGGQNE